MMPSEKSRTSRSKKSKGKSISTGDEVRNPQYLSSLLPYDGVESSSSSQKAPAAVGQSSIREPQPGPSRLAHASISPPTATAGPSPVAYLPTIPPKIARNPNDPKVPPGARMPTKGSRIQGEIDLARFTCILDLFYPEQAKEDAAKDSLRILKIDRYREQPVIPLSSESESSGEKENTDDDELSEAAPQSTVKPQSAASGTLRQGCMNLLTHIEGPWPTIAESLAPPIDVVSEQLTAISISDKAIPPSPEHETLEIEDKDATTEHLRIVRKTEELPAHPSSKQGEGNDRDNDNVDDKHSLVSQPGTAVLGNSRGQFGPRIQSLDSKSECHYQPIGIIELSPNAVESTEIQILAEDVSRAEVPRPTPEVIALDDDDDGKAPTPESELEVTYNAGEEIREVVPPPPPETITIESDSESDSDCVQIIE